MAMSALVVVEVVVAVVARQRRKRRARRNMAIRMVMVTGIRSRMLRMGARRGIVSLCDFLFHLTFLRVRGRAGFLHSCLTVIGDRTTFHGL